MKESDVRARAFAMPFTSPAFPIGPYRFVNREYLIITYRTDPRKLRELVPELLQIDEPLVKFEFIRMPDSTGFGDYTESGQVIPVTFQGRKGGYSHCMFLDDHPPIAGGPELWGFPKKLAKPTLYDEIDTLVGTLDYGSMRIATGTMGYKHKVADHDAVMASFRYQFLLTGASPGGGRAAPMPDERRARLYKQQSRRTGKADGFAPIIEPAWEGSSNLASPSCVEKGPRPRVRPEKHRLCAIDLKRPFCGSGTDW